MKKFVLSFLFAVSFSVFAQVPQGISYQAMALNGSGQAVANGNVGVRLSILDNSASGPALYTEIHNRTTNAQGLFDLVIGSGAPVTGTFSSLTWQSGLKFLSVEIDVAGGTNFQYVGTTQLLSVPYALTAGSLVLGAGQGITLTAPNGTPYVMAVNNAGQLSLPTSSAPSNAPSSLYLYGTFNGWNATNGLQFGAFGNELRGFKYFTAGTQIKFTAAQNETVVYGGNGLSGTLIQGGNAITIPSNGFYRINVTGATYQVTSINVALSPSSLPLVNFGYNVAGDYFGVTYSQGGANYSYLFKVDTTGSVITYGDNLSDGYIEVNGAAFNVGSSGTKVFKLYLNFNGYGTYTLNAP
ncbi:MAG TPA: hypothetical protein VK183_11240 [Flavobacterium sp.]|nr:hypothetical protein [Flavobacterium sp.]